MSEERFGPIEARVQKLEANVHKLTILHEDTRDWVGRIAEGVAALDEKMDRGFARVDEKMDRGFARVDEQFARVDEKIERGVARLEAVMQSFVNTQTQINRELSDRDADHETRIVALEKRRRRIP